MPFRTGDSYATGKGEVTVGKKGAKTYTGKGAAPSGTKKVREPSHSEVPTTTVSSSGTVTTSGFRSRKAARRSQRAAKAARRRTQRIIRETRPEPQRAAKRKPTSKKYEAPKAKGAPKSAPKLAARPSSKPKVFTGKPTAGAPTHLELKRAKQAGTLKVNRKGFVTTPRVRKAAKKVARLQKKARKSQPNVKGLAPEEREVVKYARKAHRKYPDVPASLLMSLMRQESGFQADAVSSADAQGLTQFIPSTAASYGVKYGTGKKEKQSQVTGAAKYLHDLGYAEDPKGALTGYTGGYSDAAYNDPVLQGAKDYKALDKPGNPKIAKKLKKAKKEAREVGLEIGKKKGGAAREAKKLKGAWAGTRDILAKAAKGFGGWSGKRTPAENAAVGGSATSDHLTTNKNSFAVDMGASGEIAAGMAKRLGIKGFTPGTFDYYTSPKYPGYRFQILWEVDGHFDHVHVGAEWTGEDLPAGTYSGGAGIGGSGGYSVSGGEITSYAAMTGTSEQAIRAKLRKKKVTPQQIFKRLRELGVGTGSTAESASESSSGSTLKELEAKYL